MKIRKHLFLFVLLASLALVGMGQQPAGSAKQMVSDRVALPSPMRDGGMSLHEALAKRQSVRDYVEQPLSPKELGQLLWAAQGINRPNGHRTAPSANALYPLEMYAVTPNGLFHYEPREHQLERISEKDLRPELSKAALGQKHILVSPGVFVFTAVYARMDKRYGEAQRARSMNMAHLEAGHTAQNLLLEAVALNLGGVPMAGFDDAAVQQALSLPRERAPIYMVAVGRPK